MDPLLKKLKPKQLTQNERIIIVSPLERLIKVIEKLEAHISFFDE